MARLVELGGAPVNQAEREVVKRLVDDLPPYWAVIPNVDIHDQRSGHPYECDAIVVGPAGVWIVEVKGWRGRIQAVSGRQWQLDDGKYVDNPLIVTDNKARVLGSHMKRLRLDGGVRPPYVGAVLAVADPRASFELFPEEAARSFHAHTIARGLGTGAGLKTRRSAGPLPYRPHIDQIVDHITRRLKGRQERARAWGSYQAAHRVGGDEQSATWLARHTLLDDGRLYRVRTWFLSSYLYDDRERAERLRVHKRAATALSRIGDHENIATLRDFGEQEGEFYEVTDWSEHGTLQTAFVRGLLKKLDDEALQRLVAGLASALDTMVEHGVYHRDLGPDSILLEPDGTPRITDFDRAFVTATTGTVYGATPLDTNPFRAPELRNPADHDVFPSSDLWSLARICQFMLDTTRLPTAVQDVLEAALRDKVEDRGVTPADLMAALRPVEAAEPATAPEPEPTLPDPAHLQPGDRIDQNTIQIELGRGANGVVYAVHNDVMQEDYALKVLLDTAEAADPLAGFRHARTVRCPHLRTVHWVGRVWDGKPYLLLDKLDGETLRSRLDRDGTVSLDAALGWMEQLCEALTALHPRGGQPGVLHRDIKPDNIMLVPRGAVLMDLSLAAPLDAAGDAPVGSPHYLPPDLADGGWDARADLFALGCVVYEALAGQHPWGDQVPSRARPASPLASIRSDLPDRMVRLIHDLLAPERASRPASPADVVQRIQSIREHQALAAAPPKPRTTLSRSAREASEALWSAGHFQSLVEAATLAVPLFQSMRRCLVRPTSTEPDDLEEAMLATEARLLALERPLPALSPRLYDQLVESLPFVASTHAADDDPPGQAPAWPDDGLLVLVDGLHPSEWDAIEAALHGRLTGQGCWRSGVGDPGVDGAAEEAARALLQGAPRALTVTSDRLQSAYASGARSIRLRLPAGHRAEHDLGGVLALRLRLLSRALELVQQHPGPAWVSATHGALFLGHGLRVDVAEGHHQPGQVRGRWAAAFSNHRITRATAELSGPVDQPTRTRGKLTYAVGRLAWPDPPGTPWLATGGLSLPERLLPVWFIGPA